jgi:hypothetical protein
MRANRGVAPPPRPARMRKAVKGAEPLRAVGTSLSGPAFDITSHAHAARALRYGPNAPDRGVCQEKLSNGQKTLSKQLAKVGEKPDLLPIVQ